MNVILKLHILTSKDTNFHLMKPTNQAYKYVREVIGEFKGNAKFYPKFYKCVSSENSIFRNLPRRSSGILGCEVVNHVLAHLTGVSVKDSSAEFSSTNLLYQGEQYHTMFKWICVQYYLWSP